MKKRLIYGASFMVLQTMIIASLTFGLQIKITRTYVWWYNFPSSPLKFAPTNTDNSMMDLRREPGDTITGYRLGCISEQDSMVRVTKRLSFKEIALASGSDYFSSSHNFKNDIDKCKESESLIAVVEVRFADGGAWTMK